MSILDKGHKLFSKLRASTDRPPLEKYYVLMLATFVGYTVADLTILYFRPMMLPQEAPPIQPHRATQKQSLQLADYNMVLDRNIFNEDGKIPPALSDQGKDGNDMFDRPAVPSQLPIQLLGTIVHLTPKYSIATVSLTSKNMSSSYKLDEVIEGMAQVTKIERKKLTFINLNNRRLEYVEIPEDAALSFDVQSGKPQDSSPIMNTGRFEFSVLRTEVENLTKDLPTLLQQARMEPVFSPDGIGIDGYRFVSIQAGSVYEKLGFKVGDMITTVNGEPVNSPTKAMELYNALRASNNIQLGVERDGRDEKFNYLVK